LTIQGSPPGVRAGHAAVNIGTKASFLNSLLIGLACYLRVNSACKVSENII